jgi:putative transposase
MQRVVAGEQLIRNDGDAELLTRAVISAAQKAGLELHAFAILPGDLRLLGTAQQITALSATMQGIARSYVAPFNRRHKRAGTLWDGRFRSTVLEPQAWLIDAMAAVENAPLRAGLVTDPAHYPWSSYRQHTGLAGELPLTDHREYWRLGNTPFERQRVYQSQLQERGDAHREEMLWKHVQAGWAIGPDDFLANLSQIGSRRPSSRKRGRPAVEASDI